MSINSLEANFLVEAAKIKLIQITKQLEKEQKQTHNRKCIAKLYTDFLEEWLLEQKSQAGANVKFPSVYNLPLSLEDYDHLKQLKEETIDAVIEKLNPKVNRKQVEDNTNKYERLLDSLFRGEDELKVLQANTKAFCANTVDECIKPKEVKEAATTLLKSRELDSEERNLLQKVVDEDEKLTSEYCSILTILLKNFEDWSWGKENLQGKMIYFHRANSKFRLLANETIGQAMFLEVLGTRLKRYITTGECEVNTLFEFHRAVWDAHLSRRLEPDGRDLINNNRELQYFYEKEVKEKYFMATLKEKNEEETKGTDDYSSGLSGNNIGMLLASLVNFNKKFPSEKGEKLAIMKTDVKDCGLSMDHQFLLLLLKKMGFDDKWMKFFKEYLTGYKIAIKDTSHVVSAQNGKGTLFAHTMSYVLNELVLVCVDFELVQKGYPIARIHDDFVFCTRGERRLAKGYLAALIESLAAVGGLELNFEKTSYVLLDNDSVEENDTDSYEDCDYEDDDEEEKEEDNTNFLKFLPNAENDTDSYEDCDDYEDEEEEAADFEEEETADVGLSMLYKEDNTNLLKNLPNEIQWQGLKLDSSGVWSAKDDLFEKVLFPLARENVNIYEDPHHHRPDDDDGKNRNDRNAKKYAISLFSIINNYNTQMKRLQSMLGPISDAFGKSHATMVLKTLCEAESYLCGGADNLSSWLMAELKNRFPDLLLEIPEGWFYWPISAGGLLAENSKIRTDGLLEAFDKNSSNHHPAYRPLAPAAYDAFLIAKDAYRKIHYSKYGFDEEMRRELAIFEKNKYKSRNKDDVKDYGFNLSEFEQCVNYEYECTSYNNQIQNWLRKLVDLKNVKEGVGPQQLDKPTTKMIESFCSRTSDFANFGGFETSGLGFYMKRIVAEYGCELQETFGNLGLIPSDLVPHNLLDSIRSSNVSKELL